MKRKPKAARLMWLLVAATLGACIDTALGLAVEVEGGQVTVAGDTLAVEVMAEVRVGTYALAGDDFILPMVGVFVGETPIAEVDLGRPEGFDGRLEPGESTVVTARGEVPLAAFPNAQTDLCGGATVATIVLTWVGEEQADDPLDPPLRSTGTAEGTATIVCP